MRKALQAIERNYLRTPLRQFVINQKQFKNQNVMSQKDVAMKHNIKEAK